MLGYVYQLPNSLLCENDFDAFYIKGDNFPAHYKDKVEEAGIVKLLNTNIIAMSKR